MKTNKSILKTSQQKIYASVEEALDAKHTAAKKFLEKIDLSKIAALGN